MPAPTPEPPSGAHDFIQVADADAADERELSRFLGELKPSSPGHGDDDGDTQPSGSVRDAMLTELDDDIDEFMAELQADPTKLSHADGEALWVGFDAEWVYDEARHQNRILSIQVYVPPQPALSTDPDKADQIGRLSRVILARGPERADRPSLQAALRQLIDTALDEHLIAAPPRLIYVVGFALRFDLGALSDFGELKRQIDSVSGKVATVKTQAEMSYARSLVTGDGFQSTLIGLHFIDAAAHAPVGTSLRAVGQLIDVPKLEIPKPFSIERMDEYLRDCREGFNAYALRDAEIAVKYAMQLAEFAKTELGIKTLPATASGLALRWYLSTLKDAGIDRLAAFGLQRAVREAYHAPTQRRRTYKDEEPTPMRRIQDALTTECYAGGRNECYWTGPTPRGHWTDFDLVGAYSTGLLDLPFIDFDKPRATTQIDDYLGHVAGYAYIDFEHLPETRYPVFAVSRGGRGLVFPSKGRTYATAPEIRAAHDLGCRITIHWGIVYPWCKPSKATRATDADDAAPDDVISQRLFGDFIRKGRQLRARLKAELKATNEARRAEGKGDIESLKEQAAKLYLNSVYGKVCQALRPKTVFDTRKVSSTRLKPSPITNPAVGSHVTGFIRAILAEILNRLPQHRIVASCTTDGFLTDASEAEVMACLDGPLCQRFQALCTALDPTSRMLEVKHEAAQIICMKTRGQLTAEPLPGRKIVLAKAGVQPVVEGGANLLPEDYKRLQNSWMLDLFMNRRPGQKIASGSFPSIRDQWENGVDLHKYEKRVALSLEPDFKREPIDPQMIEVHGRGQAHLALHSHPWRTAEDFDVARAKLDDWRYHRCLKNLEHWDSLQQALQVSANRRAQRAQGATTMNLRAGKDESDLLRRAFLRAYTQDALGLQRTMTYKELASWLTDIGQPTTAREVMSAKGQPLALRVTPPTEAVMRLWHALKDKFPDADLDQLLGMGSNPAS